MDLEVHADSTTLALRGAGLVAEIAAEAIAARGRALLAFSGGATPWALLAALATRDLAWELVDIFQIDERVAPAGDPERNLTGLARALAPVLDRVHLHPMPVELEPPEAAAEAYAETLRGLAGDPPTLDLAHLGLGTDGHTASLVPGDPVLGVVDRDVATTAQYRGRRRITLTYPVLDRARRVLWLVAGSDKREALARLLAADPGIPAGRVRQEAAWVLADRAAAER